MMVVRAKVIDFLHNSRTLLLRQISQARMYPSIRLPWSDNPTKAEVGYKNAGLVKTQGTLFMLPPDLDILISAYKAPPRPKSLMSSGATALCKHFERGGASSERGVAHPFWPLPKGSNTNKNQMAAQILEDMLKDASWRNVMMLHRGVAVYEVRNSLGYGMRWTLQVEQFPLPSQLEASLDSEKNVDSESSTDIHNGDDQWHTVKTTFRGFLEPIEGLDHELPTSDSTASTN